MPVSYSFRQAWDVWKKTDEVDAKSLPSPRSVSPPKFPNNFSLSQSSFSASVPQPSTPMLSLSHFSFPTAFSLHNLDSPIHDPLESQLFHPEPQVIQSSEHSEHTTTTSHNSYNARFFSTFNSSPASSSMTLIPSSRAPHLEFSSYLRPPVSVENHLQAWTTPFAKQQCSMLEASLPPVLIDKAYHAVHSALAPSTRSTYAAGLLRFTQFCDSWKISEQDRMPASAALLAAFVSQCLGSYSGKTLNSWLAGLHSWHIMNRAPWHGDDKWIHLARTAANKQGTTFKRPLRAPVSLEHLRMLRRNLDVTNSFHAAVWAIVLVTFFGCRRLGETTVKTLSSFSPTFNVTRTTLVSFRQLPNGSTSACIRIPWTKTTKHEGAIIVVTSRDDDLCPVMALRNHLTINKEIPSPMSLFAYQNADGSFSHMLRAHLLDFVTGIYSF
jgi:hypothetical protein